jgi:hypothetical protein
MTSRFNDQQPSSTAYKVKAERKVEILACYEVRPLEDANSPSPCPSGHFKPHLISRSGSSHAIPAHNTATTGLLGYTQQQEAPSLKPDTVVHGNPPII